MNAVTVCLVKTILINSERTNIQTEISKLHLLCANGEDGK